VTLNRLDPGDGVAEVRRGLTTEDEQLGFYLKSPKSKGAIFLKIVGEIPLPKAWAFPVWRAAASMAPRRRTSGQPWAFLFIPFMVRNRRINSNRGVGR
jgi:hypothetical protein